ncbi:MAG: hypothetical protein KJ714_05385 [Euryarchaeota archaeon]|nr:hypothetical protein [Euryarchaeota archaeon]
MEEIEKADPKLYEEMGGKKIADEEARKIKSKAEKLESPSVNQKIEQLNENIEEKNGEVKKKKEHVKDKLVSLVYKDARHGAKSDEKTFTGYKANVMKSEDGFVTNIITTSGNTYDSDILVPLVKLSNDRYAKHT